MPNFEYYMYSPILDPPPGSNPVPFNASFPVRMHLACLTHKPFPANLPNLPNLPTSTPMFEKRGERHTLNTQRHESLTRYYSKYF